MQKSGKFVVIIPILVSFLMLATSCEKEDSSGATLISSNNSSKSHNAGRNCMGCHESGGSGEGWFKVAGTVYNSTYTTVQPNGVVKLYTGANGTGTLKATIQVDAKGNFYTTDAVDFSSGLFPLVTGTSGNTKWMGASITTGQCNGCHGVNTNKISVN